MIFPNDVVELAGLVRAVAEAHPERTAILTPHGKTGRRRYTRHSYRQLSDDAEAVAVGLRELGVRERTRTVFLAPPSYEACALYLALNRVGATILMIDPSVGLRNVGERLRRLRPEAFVGIPTTHLARVVFGWGPRLFAKTIVVGDGPSYFPGARSFASLRREPPREPRPAAVGPDDAMTVLYTTGSTGPAKPALYTHRSFAGLLRNVHRAWRFDPEAGVAVDMAVFPAFFIVGLSMGGTVVVPPIDFVRQTPATTDSEAVLEVIRACGVRSLFGSPVLLENLARYACEHGVTAPSLERVIGGGAPITRDAMELLSKMMPNGEPFAAYGATEAMPTTLVGARETLGETWAMTRAGRGVCVGRPLEGAELVIAAIQDGAASSFEALPRGAIGEILVRGAHVSPAYLDDPESTRKNKIGAFHRIGDAGYLDEEGRLWVVGRTSQRVRSREGPLFPLLVEPIFDAHPAVRRSGLVGVREGDHERPVLCVELEPSVRRSEHAKLRDELLALAREHETTRSIRELLFVDRLPVDPRHNSKIERPKLARWAARARAEGRTSVAYGRLDRLRVRLREAIAR